MTKLYEQSGACGTFLPINNPPSRPLDLENSKSSLIVSQRNFIAIYNLLPTHYISVLTSHIESNIILKYYMLYVCSCAV